MRVHVPASPPPVTTAITTETPQQSVGLFAVGDDWGSDSETEEDITDHLDNKDDNDNANVDNSCLVHINANLTQSTSSGCINLNNRNTNEVTAELHSLNLNQVRHWHHFMLRLNPYLHHLFHVSN